MNGALLLVMALVALGIMALGHRKGFQPSIVILLVAGAASFIPAVPRLEMEPHLILGVVMPPLLYAAAVNFSFFTFVRNFTPIVGLGFTLVLVTTVIIGFFTSWLVPAIGLAGAFVLATVVSPPDTVTIISHGKELGLPRRVVAILTGESLVNDAAALTFFSLAVAAAAGTHTFIANPFLLFLYGCVVGIIIGLILGVLAISVRSLLANPALETSLGLILPFAAYFVAESFHASGVLAVVIAGFTVAIGSNYGSGRENRGIDYRTRTMERQVWPVIETLLEAFVFAYMGLQVRWVIEDLAETEYSFGEALGLGLLVLLAVIVIRIAWVSALYGKGMFDAWVYAKRAAVDPSDPRVIRRMQQVERMQQRQAEREERWRARDERWAERRGGRRDDDPRRERPKRGRDMRQPPRPLTWKESLLVSWTGMRGIVTLAAAGSIPLVINNGEDFPGRTLIQFIAFTVAIGTLVVQGLTVPLLAKRLAIDVTEEDAEEERQLAAAQAAADSAEGFSAKREAILIAMRDDLVTDEAARVVLERIDRQEAAAQ